MAADWIKMRTDLYRDPKVIVMADSLMASDTELARYVDHNCQSETDVTRNATIGMRNVTRNATIGALVSIWGVARRQGARDGDDLRIAGVTLAVLDDIAELPGIGEAMQAVGWAIETDEGLVFPKFFTENNVDPRDEQAAKNRERQRRYRERQREKRDVTRNVSVTSQRYARDRDREEKNIRDPASAGSCSEPPKTCGSDQPSSNDQVVMEFPTVGTQAGHYRLTEAKVAEYADAYPGVDVLAELRKALQWSRDNPTRRKTLRGMPAFLSRWLARCQDAGPVHTSTRTAAVSPVDHKAMIDRAIADGKVKVR